jgi:tetratricopeptide (TPR) repeat protein
MGLLVTWMLASGQKDEAVELLATMNAESDAVHGVLSLASEEIFEELCEVVMPNRGRDATRADAVQHAGRVHARLHAVRGAPVSDIAAAAEVDVETRLQRISRLQFRLVPLLRCAQDAPALESLAREALAECVQWGAAAKRLSLSGNSWRQMLAEALVEQGRLDEAEAALAEALAHEDDDRISTEDPLDLKVRLGVVYRDNGKLDDARRILRSVVDAVAAEAALEEEGVLEARRSFCLRLFEAKQVLGEILLSQGSEAQDMHMVQEAARLFQSVAEEDARGLLWLSDAYRALGREEEAEQALEKARSLGVMDDLDDEEGEEGEEAEEGEGGEGIEEEHEEGEDGQGDSEVATAEGEAKRRRLE